MVLSLDLEVMWDPLGSNGPYIPDMPSELQEHWQAQPLWPLCYCNRRTLVQAISIIHTYYKHHDHSRGIEQNRGRPGRCSVSAKYIYPIRQHYIYSTKPIQYIFDCLPSPSEGHSCYGISPCNRPLREGHLPPYPDTGHRINQLPFGQCCNLVILKEGCTVTQP